MSESVERWHEAQQAEKQFYDKFGRGTWNKEHAQSYLQHHFDVSRADFEGHDVLEVGCGLGIIHTLEDCTNVGIDPLANQIGKHLTAADADTLTGIGEHLPFRDEQFDAVICVNVLDHCATPKTVLEEIHRVLRRDGNVYLAVNTFDLPASIRRRLGVIDRPHPHHFEHSEVRQMMSNVGFDIQSDSTLDKDTDTRSVSTFIKTFAAVHLLRIRKSAIVARK